MSKDYTEVLGVQIAVTTYRNTLTKIAAWIKNAKKSYICVAAVHLVMECQTSPRLLAGVNRAGVVTPDGMPLVWLSKFAGKNVERVYGPTLMLKICQLAQNQGWKIFLLGGALGQTQILAEKLRQRFPRLKIVGCQDTPIKTLSERENRVVVDQINRTKPQVVFVGLGCPHQEWWMIKNRKKLSANVLVGVGAAFDIITLRTKQAPAWLQELGLEWFYRLIQEPRRLGPRYLTTNISFLWHLIKEAAGKSRRR